MRRIALLIGVTLLVVACGGSDSDTTTVTTSPLPPPDHTVSVSGFSFGPDLSARVGETVEVSNGDAIGHTWTSTNGGWDSGSLSGGRTYRFTFDTVGNFDVFCRIHSEMTGRVSVGG